MGRLYHIVERAHFRDARFREPQCVDEREDLSGQRGLNNLFALQGATANTSTVSVVAFAVDDNE